MRDIQPLERVDILKVFVSCVFLNSQKWVSRLKTKQIHISLTWRPVYMVWNNLYSLGHHNACALSWNHKYLCKNVQCITAPLSNSQTIQSTQEVLKIILERRKKKKEWKEIVNGSLVHLYSIPLIFHYENIAMEFYFGEINAPKLHHDCRWHSCALFL